MQKKSTGIKSSLGMFDLFKGYAMFFVVLAHSYGLFDNIPHNIFWDIIVSILAVLGAAAMPALFVVSGYGFRRMKLKKCIDKQISTLLVPYIISALITLFLHPITYYVIYRNRRVALQKTLELFVGMLFGFTRPFDIKGYTIESCGILWFLLALIVGNIVFNQLLGFFKGKKLAASVIIASLTGWGLSFIYPVPWAISQGLIATLYIGLGYYLKKNKVFFKPVNHIIKILLIVITIPLSAYLIIRSLFNMASCSYPCGPVSIFIFGLVALIDIYIFLWHNKYSGRWTNFVRTFGRYSLYFYCIHAIEYQTIGQYVQYDFVNRWQGSIWLRNVIVVASRFVFLSIALFVFIKIKNYFGGLKNGRDI